VRSVGNPSLLAVRSLSPGDHFPTAHNYTRQRLQLRRRPHASTDLQQNNTCNVVNSCYTPFTCNTVSRTYERKRAAFPNNFPKPARKPQHLHQQKLQASSHDIDRGSLAQLSALFRCTKIGRMASGKVTIWLYPADCCDETKRLPEKLAETSLEEITLCGQRHCSNITPPV
jgi:hypothetical protein